MRPHADFLLPDGRHASLGHGDFIGRLATAALHLDDARISEAHAMLSLRGGELKLLALRGRFAVAGKTLSDLVLAPGQRISLARDYELEVLDVVLPEAVAAVEGPGLPRQVLPALASLFTRPVPRLVARYQGDAQAWIWSTGEGWRARVDGELRSVDIGDELVVDGVSLRVVPVGLQVMGPARTRALGAVGAPLTIVAWYDTVHFLREGEPALVLTGKQARLLSELVDVGAPVSWEAVARAVWPDASDVHALRRSWDVALSRLRGRLRTVGIRPDLVHADGLGNFELILEPGDAVENRT